MSHPAGVRGLKPMGVFMEFEATKSHPAGVRGLKPNSFQSILPKSQGRTPQGCVD